MLNEFNWWAVAALVLAGLVVVMGLFLALRAVVLWYLRINQALQVLDSINHKLGRMLDNAQTIAPSTSGHTHGAGRLTNDGL